MFGQHTWCLQGGRQLVVDEVRKVDFRSFAGREISASRLTAVVIGRHILFLVPLHIVLLIMTFCFDHDFLNILKCDMAAFVIRTPLLIIASFVAFCVIFTLPVLLLFFFRFCYVCFLSDLDYWLFSFLILVSGVYLHRLLILVEIALTEAAIYIDWVRFVVVFGHGAD